MSQKWSLGRKSGNASSRPGHWSAPLNGDPGPSTGWDVPDPLDLPAEEPAAPLTDAPAPLPEPAAPSRFVATAPPTPAPVPVPQPEPQPAPQTEPSRPPTPAASDMGERVAQSIGVWQDFVTDLVAEVDRKAAEHLATIDAAASQRHRELTDAVAQVGDNLQRQAADVAAAIERQAAEVLQRVEERFRAIASECATTVAVAEQAAEAWRVTIDNAGTAKKSELDATMAKHLLSVEDVVLHTREGLEEAASAEIARFESQVKTLRDDLRREAEDQTLAFEDLAALRLVELEERLGQTVDTALPAPDATTETSGPKSGNGASNGSGDLGAARFNGLRSVRSS